MKIITKTLSYDFNNYKTIMKNLLKFLNKKYNFHFKDVIEYIRNRKWVCKDCDILTKHDVKMFLSNFEPADQYENTAFDSGFLIGFRTAIGEVEKYKLFDSAQELNKWIKQQYHINLVTCGRCWTILSHKLPLRKKLIRCTHCKFESDPCDFPDLFY